MKKECLLEVAKKCGFGSIDDFVRANLHYLPREKRELFCCLAGYKKEDKYCCGAGYD